MYMVLGLGLVLGFTTLGMADDKEKTVKGTICCAKCELKMSDKCATVIKVKDGDKELIYYFDAECHKKNHGKICNEAKEGEATGVLGKDGKKLTIKVSKVEFK
jgi:hypothetical protein